jgi:hypothetical protein
MATNVSNPKVSTLLRTLTWVEVGVVGAAAGLFGFPGLVVPHWPWALTPFNAYFVGVAYFTAWLPLVVFAWTGRWNPGRLVLAQIGAFTAYALLVSLLHREVFLVDRPGTIAWWVLYVALPINSAIHLWLYRRWPPAEAAATPPAWRRALTVLALGSGLYALAMFIAPVAATGWWPWPMNAFNGRMYAVIFLSLAVGFGVVRARASRLELLVQGCTALILGLTAVSGLFLTDIGRNKIVLGAATWAWLATFALFGVAGAGLIGLSRARGSSRPGAA